MLGVLAPFHQATVELLEQKRVSGSKVIPLLKMVHLALQRKASNAVTWTAKKFIENLQRVTDILCNLHDDLCKAAGSQVQVSWFSKLFESQ